MNEILGTALSRPIVTNAIRIALVVGSVLNVINRGEALLSWSGISWHHVALNFVVPYCVASYSAAKNQLNNRRN
ncbi:MAG: nitrate/nitrite transporter NrtS [Azonexus sp.]|nr:nitrate/nitrite transporter NrtS [Azonexus sp.]